VSLTAAEAETFSNRARHHPESEAGKTSTHPPNVSNGRRFRRARQDEEKEKEAKAAADANFMRSKMPNPHPHITALGWTDTNLCSTIYLVHEQDGMWKSI
jgi:hypothetical protein